MKKDKRKTDQSCTMQCHQSYSACLEKGEHESVCTMKRVPCLCGCVTR